MQFRNIFLAVVASIATVSVFSSAHAAKPAVYTGTFSNVAVQGHDPVAYFTEGAPVEGSKDFTTTYNGAEWRFASEENLNTFLADPDKYAPQYGGYCAWAVSQGYTAKGDANYWAIVDGKLYLNYNEKVQNDWSKDIPGFIQAANTNWPNVIE
ncbi:MAG: YHS domain-containing (seleno)protein [Pseudomonadota bacterium]